MNHLDEGTLQAILDGDPATAHGAGAAEHLAGCAECRAHVEELRAASALFASLVARIPEPVLNPAVAEAAREQVLARRGVVHFPERAWRKAGRYSAGSLARAAILLLAFAAAASATIPGSPVRHWLSVAWERTTSIFAGGDNAPVAAPVTPAAPSAVSTPAAAAPVSPAATVSGVSVRPVNGRVEVVVNHADARIRVRMVEGASAVVQASGNTAGTSFRTGPGRIEVVGGGMTELVIELPNVARRATVTVDGKVYLSKEGTAIRVSGPVADSTAAGLLFKPRP